MTYKEELRRRICRLTGLTGIEVDHILRALEMQNVDPETIDWKTLGEDIKDKANPYEAAWDWLFKNYGITKPPEFALERRYEEAFLETAEYLLSQGKEGVRAILRKIYEEDIPEEERRRWKKFLLERAAENVTLLAIHDGKEREYAKRFLAEEVLKEKPRPVVTEKQVLDLIKAKSRTLEELVDRLKAPPEYIEYLLHRLMEKGEIEYEPVRKVYRVPLKFFGVSETEKKLLELIEKKKRLKEAKRMTVLAKLRDRYPELIIEKVEINELIHVKVRIPEELRYAYRHTDIPIFVTGKDVDEVIENLDRALKERYRGALYEAIEEEEKIRETLRKGLEVTGRPEVEKIKTEEMTYEEICNACLKWGTQTDIDCPTCSTLARLAPPEEHKIIGKLKSWNDVYCCPVCHRLFSKDLSLLWYPPPTYWVE
ncbi:MAG: hypothetical protein DRN03_00305 [Thermoplasmata archaeon]|nr:MAG: hypothetical protein DRN03_00305 [Thermoplasmata archaeon]